jgi:hypothetical protein
METLGRSLLSARFLQPLRKSRLELPALTGGEGAPKCFFDCDESVSRTSYHFANTSANLSRSDGGGEGVSIETPAASAMLVIELESFGALIFLLILLILALTIRDRRRALRVGRSSDFWKWR